jgi:hypothetical protein
MTAGSFTNTGTTILFNGLGDQSLASSGAFNHFTINKSSGTAALNGNLTINGNTTLTAGIFNIADKIPHLKWNGDCWYINQFNQHQ